MRRGATALDVPDEGSASASETEGATHLCSHVRGTATSRVRDLEPSDRGRFDRRRRARETDAPARWPPARLLRRRRLCAKRSLAIRDRYGVRRTTPTLRQKKKLTKKNETKSASAEELSKGIFRAHVANKTTRQLRAHDTPFDLRSSRNPLSLVSRSPYYMIRRRSDCPTTPGERGAAEELSSVYNNVFL
jgi:hypothetical protein